MALEPAPPITLVGRPYSYATGMDRTVHAYTRQEWGIGGSQPSGNYSVPTATGASSRS